MSRKNKLDCEHTDSSVSTDPDLRTIAQGVGYKLRTKKMWSELDLVRCPRFDKDGTEISRVQLALSILNTTLCFVLYS